MLPSTVSLHSLSTPADGRKIVSHGFMVVAFVRNVFTITGPAVTNPWRKGMGLGGMFICAAFVSLAVNLLAVPLLIWGKRIRIATASRYHRLSQQTK